MRKTFILLLALAIPSAAVDQKSLLLGVAIGLGVYTTQHGVVPALAGAGRGVKRMGKVTGRGVKRMGKVTGKGVRRAVMGPKKKPGGKR